MQDVVFTGAYKAFGKVVMTRDELNVWAAQNGIKARPSFCSKTNLVVAAKPSATSSKIRKAKEAGIRVVTYQTFVKEVRAAQTQVAEQAQPTE